MEGKNRMTFALIAGVAVLAVSLGIAWVLFRVLESTAGGDKLGFKLGGAIAGFAFTATLLTGIIFQIYRQLRTDRSDEYRRENEELRAKLIKGASCPAGYAIDIDERNRLVFARPAHWLPRGGILYQYVCPPDPEGKNEFLENFNVFHHGRLEARPEDMDQLYRTRIGKTVAYLKARFKSEDLTVATEYVIIDGVKSLKAIITHTPEPATIDRENKLALRQSVVFSYVPRLKSLFEFTFSEDKKHYLASSEVFNNILESVRFL